MPKYYVKSNELEVIVNAPTPLEAAKTSVLLCAGELIDHVFYVDERGFRGPDNEQSSPARWVFPYASVVSDYG